MGRVWRRHLKALFEPEQSRLKFRPPIQSIKIYWGGLRFGRKARDFQVAIPSIEASLFSLVESRVNAAIKDSRGERIICYQGQLVNQSSVKEPECSELKLSCILSAQCR